jgi:predicted nuclease of predicted toxin-antitoxin system
MAQRIRYNKVDGKLVSRNEFVTLDDVVTVSIDTDFAVRVTKFGKDDLVVKLQARNLADAKKIAKSTLATLGVNFESEVRVSKKNQLVLTPNTERVL